MIVLRRLPPPARIVTLLFAVLLLAAPAAAQERTWRGGLSLFGDVKYPDDFKHFDYVNPDAPKGGTARLAGIGSFDSLNPFTFKGRPAALSAEIYDTLMKPSLDEPSSEYGLIAEAASYPADFSSVTFRLRPQARWHDGEPVTPDDVVFSMESLKKTHPGYAAYYQNVVKAEVTGEREVTFTFDQKGNRELPQITGQLPVLPRHWWTGTSPDGRKRDLASSTLEIPLGSGPYKIVDVQPGRSITLGRVEDYWGKDLPVNVGINNFDRMQAEYFRDSTVALEAFKGNQIDFRVESSAKDWATAYDFPARTSGAVILEEFKTKQGDGMQGFAFNTRRNKFKDPRVRQAFNLAFNFEWANRNLFYGQYKRTESFFSNSELASSGLPEGRELEILNEVKDQVPPEVFTTEYKAPVNETTRDQRANLRAARELLEAAGWQIRDRVLTNTETGERMEVEFLLVSPAFERVVLPYAKELERLGIRSSVRTVDTSQYQNRTDQFDFDIVVTTWGQSLSPGNEQRDFWGSEAADRTGGRNLVGIKDKAIDHLIDKVIYATDRDDLIAATRALDRVLLWHHFVVPQWHTPVERVARWNRFSHPETMPDYSIGFPDIWWWDQAKADAVAGRR